MTLDRYGHLLPGRAQDVAERLDVFARTTLAEAAPPVVRLDDARETCGTGANRDSHRESGNRP